MNSASQSKADAGAARRLLGEVDELTARGRRLASPVWFPQLCAAVAILASVPAGLLLGSEDGAGWYWSVAAPLTAVASGWFFATRRAQPPAAVGALVLATGLLTLAGSLAIVWLGDGSWAMAPWLVFGVGFGVFAVAWRSQSTAVVSAVTVATALVVAVLAPGNGYLVVALVVGLVAAIAAASELVRAEPGRGA